MQSVDSLILSCLKYFYKDKEYDEVSSIFMKYWDLANLNPKIESCEDAITYIFVKIMFEHPLVDGNKRLATTILLIYCGVEYSKIDKIRKFLAKEVK